MIKKLNKNHKGAALAEYLISLALIGGVTLFTIVGFGTSVGAAFSSISENISITDVAPTTPAAPSGPAANHEYHEVLDGFGTNFIQFDDANPTDDLDVVDMENFSGTFGMFVSINFFDAKEFSIFDSSTGQSLHFVDAEELRLPLNPAAIINIDKDGWDAENNFTTIINE